ncbi:NADH-quinone oxidoreductase subunit J [Sphaerisporangium viridialbum]|uniref:NADH-quinone oxidoreductase subunit J n=1 Tax=Sphaerisporangium viridialbum TaxID=46189 RepID=UPI003C7194C9
MGETITFWVLAVVSVAAAFGLVFSRKAVYSALMLGVVMLSLAVLYAVQDAPFLAVVQIIVYTGAVMMLFLFVLMLVGVDSSDSLVETIKGQRFWAVIAGLGFAVLLAAGIGNAVVGDPVGLASAVKADGGNVPALAHLIFTRYVFAFEVTSALLITAALGAMVLAHRERSTPKASQKELSRARFLGGHPGTLPGPGTYARHNAIDMPALLPDGTVSELSVNRFIARHDVEDGRLPENPRLAQAIRNVAAGPGRTEKPKVVQAVAEKPEGSLEGSPEAEEKPKVVQTAGTADGPVQEEGK